MKSNKEKSDGVWLKNGKGWWQSRSGAHTAGGAAPPLPTLHLAMGWESSPAIKGLHCSQ